MDSMPSMIWGYGDNVAPAASHWVTFNVSRVECSDDFSLEVMPI